MSRTILMMFSFSSVWFCYFLLLYQVSMNIYCTKFWTKIWITRWELKIFVSLRWEPKPHFIGACLVPPLPCSSNRLNGAGVFIVYSGQMHTVTSPVGYFPNNLIFSRVWAGKAGAGPRVNTDQWCPNSLYLLQPQENNYFYQETKSL